MESNEVIQLRNQAIWEMAMDAIVTIDEQGNIVAYNPAAETLFGHCHDDAIGQNVSLLMPESYQSPHNDALRQRRNQAKINHHHGVIGHSRPLEGLHKDGSIIPIRLALSEITINGQHQFMAIIQDISELKATETALRESEQRLHTSQDFAGIGTWDWNIETNELFWTDQVPPLFGLPKSELETSYKNFISAVHIEDRLLVEDAISACINHSIPYNIEHRVVWPDGSVHWLHGSGDVIQNQQHKPNRMIGIVSDINAAKQTQLALHKSEAWFRDITESTSDWIWEVDANGRYTYCSGNVEAILGYRPEEIIGRTPFDLMPPDEAQVFGAVFANIVKYKSRIDNLENWNLTKNGQRVCLLTSGVPLLDDEGELLGYRGVDKDITSRKQTEMALINAKEEAEQANLAKSEFLSNMSHELRTPLNAIIGFAQLFGLDGNLNDDQKKNLYEINRAGEHLLELINEILDLAKIEAGRLDLDMAAVSINEILEECNAISRSQAKEYTVQLNIDMNSDTTAFADRTRLKQVLLNLISNGIKYNQPRGTVEVKVDGSPDTHCRITVSDTGRGITSENLQYLFQPFNRLGIGQAQIEGSGIGLVISKNIVEAMGGNIGVKSTPNKGSKFWIEIPKMGAPEPLLNTNENFTDTSNHQDKNNLEISKGPCRILAVEDTSTNQVLLCQQLQTLHYEVDMASNGVEALNFLSKNPYRLVLTDCNMPKMNGFQLTEIIRQQENGLNHHLPVVAITANTVLGEAKRCRHAGMDDYLEKPVKLEDLNVTIEKYWARSTVTNQPLFTTSIDNAHRQMIFDITVLQNTLGHQPTSHRHVLSIFTQSVPSNIDEITQAVKMRNPDELNVAAHKLKSASRAIGARILSAICQLLEANSYDLEWENISALLTALTNTMNQVEADIAEYIGNNA